MDGKFVSITLDVTLDNYSIIIGTDIERYEMTDNLERPSHMKLCRPEDINPRRLRIYRSGGAIDSRLRLKILPAVPEELIGTMNADVQADRSATLENIINRTTHDPAKKISDSVKTPIGGQRV